MAMHMLHQMNTDGSISLPFGCAAETYILLLPIVKDAHFKCQSQQKVNQAIQKNLVIFKHKEGAIDFKGWTMINGMTQSTNRLDDRLELTEKGQSYVIQIQQGLVLDLYGCTAKEVKLKLLTPFNGASKEQLKQQEKCEVNICSEQKIQQLIEQNSRYSHDVGSWTILHSLVMNELKEKGFVLYYQQEDQNFSLNSPKHYYQLTVSDNMWLEQARDYDAKYDLNNNQALIHTLVVEDGGNWGTPIGFALSNKENMYTIRLVVEAIRANIPLRCINQRKLKVLQNNILEVLDNPDFLYVHMNNYKQNTFQSLYMADKIRFEDSKAQGVSKMIKKLAEKHIVPILPDYYLVNYITGKCICLDFIWHGSFRDCCKHGHAAHIYVSIKANENSIDQIKKELIQYF
ncbi:19734_t:CDS:2 [Cetraspora pellucida]|uniref:19734_t:CDS:1 n=1 Tax=Cetraspora pellucida TaxID=1433469 RepID=A0A9N9J5S4_9GLOM|nr:19734_t:CDS:2 [Cetraspora pellucida]